MLLPWIYVLNLCSALLLISSVIINSYGSPYTFTLLPSAIDFIVSASAVLRELYQLKTKTHTSLKNSVFLFLGKCCVLCTSCWSVGFVHLRSAVPVVSNHHLLQNTQSTHHQAFWSVRARVQILNRYGVYYLNTHMWVNKLFCFCFLIIFWLSSHLVAIAASLKSISSFQYQVWIPCICIVQSAIDHFNRTT